MIETRPAALSGAPEVTRTAKAALRRLALDKLEPTPENYARAYRLEGGDAPADEAPALAALIERIVRGVERGGRHWTAARKKDSLQRVLDSSRSDSRRLQQRLSQLVTSWGSDSADVGIDTEMGLAELDAVGAPVGAAPTEVAAPADHEPPLPGLTSAGCRRPAGDARADHREP
jgi:diguanylate cyclase